MTRPFHSCFSIIFYPDAASPGCQDTSSCVLSFPSISCFLPSTDAPPGSIQICEQKKSAIPKELPIKKSSTIILVTSVNIIKFKLHIIPIICIFFHLHPLASAGNLRVARNTFCETKKYIMKRNAICKKWNVPKALPCNAFRSHVNPALTVTFLKTARAAASKDSKSDVANNHRGFESHPLCQ